MGTPEFAVEPLRRLVDEGYNVVAVIAMPDKPFGRGLKLKGSAVKEYALTVNLPILQPVKLSDPSFVEELRSFNPELGVVVAFKMLPTVIWSMPKYGTFNLHTSLLPDYRGAAPINWAIINGDKESGLTTFMLDKNIDTGDILLREKISISDGENAGSLHDKMMLIGGDLVLRSVDMIATENIIPLPQSNIEESKLRHAPKIFKDDCKIDWNDDISAIYNKVRGLSPYPAAWFEIGNDTFKVYKASKELSDASVIGKVVTDGKLFFKIGCKGGYILIEELQMAGKKRMKIEDFLRGFKGLN